MILYSCHSCGRENRIPAKKLDARARCGNCKALFLPFDQPYNVPDAMMFEELIRESPLPLIIDFWADWCGPCHMIAGELKKLAHVHSGDIVVAKVNTELPQLRTVIASFNIRSLPTLIRFDKGRETKRVLGAQSTAQLEAAFDLEPASRARSA
jgi:thioredoxin 2